MYCHDTYRCGTAVTAAITSPRRPDPFCGRCIESARGLRTPRTSWFYNFLELFQFRCGNAKLGISAVQADRRLLADIHGRQVYFFLPSEGNGKLALKVLLARGTTLLAWHVPLLDVNSNTKPTLARGPCPVTFDNVRRLIQGSRTIERTDLVRQRCGSRTVTM